MNPENSEISIDGGKGPEETRRMRARRRRLETRTTPGKGVGSWRDHAALWHYAFPCCSQGCARQARVASVRSTAPRLSRARTAAPAGAAAATATAAVAPIRRQEPASGPNRITTRHINPASGDRDATRPKWAVMVGRQFTRRLTRGVIRLLPCSNSNNHRTFSSGPRPYPIVLLTGCPTFRETTI